MKLLELFNDMWMFVTVLLMSIDKSLYANIQIPTGVLLMTKDDFPVDVRRIGPAIDIALNHSLQIYNVDFRITVSNYSVFCHKAKYVALGNLADLYYKDGIRAFIGPACSDAVKTTGKLAEYLRVPLVTGLGDLALRQKYPIDDMYNTTTILSYNIEKLSVSLVSILKEYGWKHTSILYDIDEVFFERIGFNLVQDFRSDEYFERPYDMPYKRNTKNLGGLLQEASKYARVFIILAQAKQFRQLMWHAYQLGMAEGDYVFITFELFPSDWWGRYKQFTDPNIYTDMEKNHGVAQAYRNVLLLNLLQHEGPLYTQFKNKLKFRALRDYSYHFKEGETDNYFIRAFYESVIYLALAYNRTAEAGDDINDGWAVARRFWNDTFYVPSLNETVAIDEYGNRIADIDVVNINGTTTDPPTFQTVGKFYGSTLKYYPSSNVDIQWIKGPPPDVPVCGFIGELCLFTNDDGNLTAIAISVSVTVVIIIVIVISTIVYTIKSRNQSLYEMKWKIPSNKLQVIQSNKSVTSGFSRSRLSIMGDHTSFSMDSEDKAQIYANVGHYNGTMVAIRKLQLQSVDLNKNVLIELKQLHSLRHNNIAAFVGACIDPGHIAIVVEYCPRGSLQDILENDSIDLDWTFRKSLIYDVICGMKYIHSSDIKYHGRLRSSSCVVDSRFLLKIRSYGPKCLFNSEQQSISKCEINYNKLLWTAPEHLHNDNTTSGSREGDVYSFAMILQEIVTRSPPFEDANMPAVEIIKKVKHAGSAGFRPNINNDCPSLLAKIIKACWAEDPRMRPNFESIGTLFSAVYKGKNYNILDNLISRMEQYANNLENLVEERTKAYIDEKKRAEILLYRMLPKSVAESLQHGKQVDPEVFESVSIYFSDIVGFTSIAARSTPLDVVNFLNELYTCFDATINKFDVYKVETIGDAYMVVSGLPKRNGIQHAQHIADMSLAILNQAMSFTIHHLPEEDLRIRIGLHSGNVVAGVVGLTMPRYCLFGDTVNTASRMESNGDAMKIHISQDTKYLLDMLGRYQILERGDINIKGKGTMKTYWLENGS